ncbi:sulfatase-like hydrolase/transferase [Candidatus Halobonum tyrrellensis]|uniref:Sulfatase n=1 Tax=Candidatus Halobonum tyrrellensis G22 TaxID=1324957 RepID=V4HFZ3_9EURY|nr:sulfatase-like hydrolase/transferase [Candidatus Halobonum tyrrellensis]ESP89033.1 sulfatase [Candidatus Halobonum tyrrellensis G22]
MQPTLLVTVDSLRYDHYQYMPATREFLGESHPAAFATNTATPLSFQSIVGGVYPGEAGITPEESFVPRLSNEYKVAVSTNRFLSERYGYDAGFDRFVEPPREGKSLKDRIAENMTPQSRLYGVASRLYNAFEGVRGTVQEAERHYRPAAAVIDDFLGATDGRDDWFGWLHFMEPHHPYNPDDAPVSRSEAQRVTRRLLDGRGSEADAELGRELYRGEVEELDDRLARLWDAVPDDTRVLLCADHGELLGEYGEWGHHGTLAMELLRVPFVGRNLPVDADASDVRSLVDVPSLFLGEPHGDGLLDREAAFGGSGGTHAAMNARHFATRDGVRTLDGEPASDRDLARALDEWAATAQEPATKEELPEDDLEALGYK